MLLQLLLLSLFQWPYHDLVVHLLGRGSHGISIAVVGILWVQESSLAITNVMAVSLVVIVINGGGMRILITVLI